MLSSVTIDQSASEKTAQFSTRLAFFISGFCMASWAPLVPLVKDRAGIDEGVLGLLLLCLGVGSITAMPISGYLVGRYGCRRVIVVAALLMCLSLPLLACLSSIPTLVIAIIAFGIGMGAIDCAMNIQAVIVNDASQRPIMSSFHGLFSLGGILGAVGMTAMLGVGLSPVGASLCVVGITLVSLIKASPNLLPFGGGGGAPVFVLPKGKVLILGVMCFIVFMAEGAMLDWSGVFLVSLRGMEAAYGGLGYAAFAATMTIARLTGDSVISRFGAIRVLAVGSVFASVGIAFSLCSSSWLLALLGYAMVGAGCANIVPVLFTAVARQTDMPQASAVPAMTTLGYAGVLIGPAFIGFVAHASSLIVALAFVAVALLIVAALSRSIRV
ncbi:MFS transporter [Pseudomonas sp. NPDC088429]|uniref:MFS transporter n=1 Tax=Pseudomonas sp. NPDC088429 TaxID=3364455 RepID=UPI0037F93DC3